MTIESQPVKIQCDFCDAYYIADKPVLKSGWQHVNIGGIKGLVACPREIVEQVIKTLTSDEAYELEYDMALRMATRAGANILGA